MNKHWRRGNGINRCRVDVYKNLQYNNIYNKAWSISYGESNGEMSLLRTTI